MVPSPGRRRRREGALVRPGTSEACRMEPRCRHAFLPAPCFLSCCTACSAGRPTMGGAVGATHRRQPVTNGREDCVWTRARARQWSGACGQGTSYMDGVLGPAGLPVRCAGCGRDAREACPGRTGEGCAGVEATGDGLPMGGVSPWEVPANGGTGRRNTMMRRRDDDAEEMGWRGLPMDGGVACLMRAAAVPLAAWARGSMVAR